MNSEHEIEVVINLDFPYYKLVKDTAEYSTFLIVEFLSLYIQGRGDAIGVLRQRNEILRNIGLAKRESSNKKRKEEKITKLEKELKKLKGE